MAMDPKEAMATYLAAVEEERSLWAQVRHTIPSQPGYDAELWKRWSQAADRTHAASKSLHEALEADRKRPRS